MEPTKEDLARLFAAMMALEPEFRGIPGWRLRELAHRLAGGISNPPSPEEVAAALAWVKEVAAALVWVNDRARARREGAAEE